MCSEIPLAQKLCVYRSRQSTACRRCSNFRLQSLCTCNRHNARHSFHHSPNRIVKSPFLKAHQVHTCRQTCCSLLQPGLVVREREASTKEVLPQTRLTWVVWQWKESSGTFVCVQIEACLRQSGKPALLQPRASQGAGSPPWVFVASNHSALQPQDKSRWPGNVCLIVTRWIPEGVDYSG